MKIRWEFGADWVPNASRLFLGSCRASQLNVLPTSQGEALFNYPFSACKFKKLVKIIILRKVLFLKLDLMTGSSFLTDERKTHHLSK